MKKEYDFSSGERGRFHRPRRVQRTLRLDEDVLIFFEEMAVSAGVPYQTLINLTLRKFAVEDGEIVITTKKTKRA